MSFSGSVFEQIVVHATYGTVLSHQKRRTIVHPFDGFHGNCTEWKSHSQRLYTGWLHLYNSLEMIKLQRWRRDKGFLGVMEENWKKHCRGERVALFWSSLLGWSHHSLYVIKLHRNTYRHRHKCVHIQLVKSELSQWFFSILI